MTTELVPQGVLAAACLTAGWLDTSQRRIPNWLCAVTLCAGLTAAFFTGGLSLAGSHGLHFLIGLIGGMLLFKAGAFGGGDAKFYAAVAGWFPFSQAVLLFVSVAFCGLLLLIVWFMARRLAGKPIRGIGGDPKAGLPYGVAIGAGAVLAQSVQYL